MGNTPINIHAVFTEPFAVSSSFFTINVKTRVNNRLMDNNVSHFLLVRFPLVRIACASQCLYHTNLFANLNHELRVSASQPTSTRYRDAVYFYLLRPAC